MVPGYQGFSPSVLLAFDSIFYTFSGLVWPRSLGRAMVRGKLGFGVKRLSALVFCPVPYPTSTLVAFISYQLLSWPNLILPMTTTRNVLGYDRAFGEDWPKRHSRSALCLLTQTRTNQFKIGGKAILHSRMYARIVMISPHIPPHPTTLLPPRTPLPSTFLWRPVQLPSSKGTYSFLPHPKRPRIPMRFLKWSRMSPSQESF